jgi:hypothetical protein
MMEIFSAQDAQILYSLSQIANKDLGFWMNQISIVKISLGKCLNIYMLNPMIQKKILISFKEKME